MIRAVLDTNVLVSVLIGKLGKPAQIMQRADKFDLLTSNEILAELAKVLHYPRIRNKYKLSDQTVQEHLDNVRQIATLVHVQKVLDVVRDPDDNKILSCALDGQASHLVTGDPDLLDLDHYQGIQILRPNAFLALFQDM